MTTRGLKIDPATSDIVHDGHHLQTVADLDAVAQSLRTRLSLFQGEVFWDEAAGTPYFQTILGKQAPLIAVREAFRQVIAGTPGVLDVVSLTLDEGDAPREFILTFRVSTDLGELSLTLPTAVP